MVKTIGQIIDIYNGLQIIRSINLEITRFRQLRKIIPVIEEEFKIYLEKEQELLLKHSVLDERGNPIILKNDIPNFKNDTSKAEYIREMNDVRRKEINIDIPESVTIRENELGTVMISYNAVEAMKDIINFEWEENLK